MAVFLGLLFRRRVEGGVVRRLTYSRRGGLVGRHGGFTKNKVFPPRHGRRGAAASVVGVGTGRRRALPAFCASPAVELELTAPIGKSLQEGVGALLDCITNFTLYNLAASMGISLRNR